MTACAAAPARIFMPAVFLLVLGACGSQVNLENYGKLKVGQSYDEVKQIVGPATRCDEMLGVRSCTWGDAQRGIEVNFLADKVVLLSAKDLK